MPELLELEPPAKLNLFLEVLGRRADAYHDLDTVMHGITLRDRMIVRRSAALRVECEGRGVGGGDSNLAWKAVRALEARVGRPLPVEIRIEKHIPAGGGFGGGSSDAAHALMAVDVLHGLGLGAAGLAPAAADVGSDVAFFLTGGTAACGGRGEIVTPVPCGTILHFAVVLPPLAVPTPLVYRDFPVPGVPRTSESLRAALRDGDADLVRRRLFNRLEARARSLFPELDALMAKAGALAGRPPLLTGSGSGFFLPCGSAGEAVELAAAVASRLGVETFAAASAPPDGTV